VEEVPGRCQQRRGPDDRQVAIAVNGSPGESAWRPSDAATVPIAFASMARPNGFQAIAVRGLTQPSATRVITPPEVAAKSAVVDSNPVTIHLARLRKTGTRQNAAFWHYSKALRCLSMNVSSAIGGRPPSFSTRSFVPAKMPF
jgi:hypothetical protein